MVIVAVLERLISNQPLVCIVLFIVNCMKRLLIARDYVFTKIRREKLCPNKKSKDYDMCSRHHSQLDKAKAKKEISKKESQKESEDEDDEDKDENDENEEEEEEEEKPKEEEVKKSKTKLTKDDIAAIKAKFDGVTKDEKIKTILVGLQKTYGINLLKQIEKIGLSATLLKKVQAQIAIILDE